MELLKHTNMIYAIYLLKNPITNQIVYVGKTSDLDLNHYLKSKYWKLNEVNRGERNITPLFKLMNELLPNKLTIHLIKYVDESKPFQSADFTETYYIKEYSKDYKLLNITDGGTGGNTYKYKSNEEISNIGKKVSEKLKGRKKPEGFAEHLSHIRKGKNNPMAKKINVGIYDKNNNLIHICHYGFEVNEFLNNKWFWSNYGKGIKCGIAIFKHGYKIKRIV